MCSLCGGSAEDREPAPLGVTEWGYIADKRDDDGNRIIWVIDDAGEMHIGYFDTTYVNLDDISMKDVHVLGSSIYQF